MQISLLSISTFTCHQNSVVVVFFFFLIAFVRWWMSAKANQQKKRKKKKANEKFNWLKVVASSSFEHKTFLSGLELLDVCARRGEMIWLHMKREFEQMPRVWRHSDGHHINDAKIQLNSLTTCRRDFFFFSAFSLCYQCKCRCTPSAPWMCERTHTLNTKFKHIMWLVNHVICDLCWMEKARIHLRFEQFRWFEFEMSLISHPLWGIYSFLFVRLLASI